MNRTLKITGLALMLGVSTAVSAQTISPAQAFASRLQQYQNLSASSGSTYAFHPAPMLTSEGHDPVGNQSFAQRFADLQATSSNDSDAFQQTRPTFSALGADPEPKESFAQRFAELQADSSNSGLFTSGALGDRANGRMMAAKAGPRPMQPVNTAQN